MLAGVFGASRLGDGLRRLSERSGGLADIPFDERAFRRSGDVALLQQRQWSTPELRLERGVLHHPPTGASLVGWLRIDNRDDLRRQLDADARGPGATDGGLVLLAWLRWGDGLCEHLLGDFALAIHDPRDRSLLLARDPMGVKPLYYMEAGDALAFATGLGVLADLAGPDLTLSEEWLARYVADCASDPERTVYRQVRKVPPGHLLRFRNGRSELRRHFAFDPEARDGFRSSAERLEAYRGLLAEATACRVRAEGAVACELSGGLDSATVTAHAALAMQDAGERLHAVGFATEEQEPGPFSRPAGRCRSPTPGSSPVRAPGAPTRRRPSDSCTAVSVRRWSTTTGSAICSSTFWRIAPGRRCCFRASAATSS